MQKSLYRVLSKYKRYLSLLLRNRQNAEGQTKTTKNLRGRGIYHSKALQLIRPVSRSHFLTNTALSDHFISGVLEQIPLLCCRMQSAKPNIAPARLPAMENPHCSAWAAKFHPY